MHQIAAKLETEVRQQTGFEFRVFVDRDDIAWGQNWTRALREGLEQSGFLIPVITPSYFTSPYCRTELDTFIDKEKRLGRDDLICPIYYI